MQNPPSAPCLLLVGLLLSACGGEAPATTSGAPVHEIDFSGGRHRLHVALQPTLSAWTPAEEDGERAYDLVLTKESGHRLRVVGNGRRSVAFVRVGTSNDYDAFRELDTWPDVRAFAGERGVYFSPELRAEEAVEGAIFLAWAGEDVAGEAASHARVRIEEIGDTSVRLRVVVGERLVP